MHILNAWNQRQLKNLTERAHPRLDALFDAVVAIAMTMMALEISVPDTSVFDWATFILLLKEITVYLISFLALASVWSIHTTLTINTASASIPTYILNVALMFVITVFPVLTKLMDSAGGSKLLYGVYLGGYALMECLILVEFLFSYRESHLDTAAQMRRIRDILEIWQDANPDKSLERIELEKRLELAQQYLSERSVSEQLFQELLLKLPEPFQERYRRHRTKQRMQVCKTVAFSIVAFLAIVASVTVLGLNPFLCYAILLAGGICYAFIDVFITSYFHRKDE
ncbi:TMEM175 family protein [Pseudoscardovia radai]